jgi:lysophospholipase L1-like esterase
VRERLARLALSVVSIVGGLIALELAFRAFGYAPQRGRDMARVHDEAWTELLDCYPSNPRHYFTIDLRTPAAHQRFERLAPHRFDAIAERAPYAVDFHYNALRFRERPPDSPRPGRTRVVVIGDSFTEGQGVNEEDTYPRALEARLNASEPDRWEVRNCARRATDFPRLNDVYAAALQYHPDVVVYGMVLNDAERTEAFQDQQHYVNDWILDHTQTQDGAATPPSVLRSRLWAFVDERWAAYAIGRASTRWYQEMYGPENAEGWARTQQYIREMDTRTRASGGRFLVALWPLLVDFGRSYPFRTVHERIQRFCATAGIPFLDLLPALQPHPAPDLWVHPLDHHPNEIAHRITADALLPVVRPLARR